MKETPEDILYQIALLEMTDIGPSKARKLIDYFGSAREVIDCPENDLKQLGTVGERIISQRGNEEYINFAKAQLEFCEARGAKVLSYYSKNYPFRLKQCADAPLILYQKGHCNLNAHRMVAIVGTRNCTSYGRDVCAKLVKELGKYNVTIVSGLAFGIDGCAHRESIKNDMFNVAVVAHGLDRIYPSDHRELANQIVQKGAVLTEFTTKTIPDRENFPKRNRIVAGMVDAIIVVESAIKGGSMITARLGNVYNRDVFAVPGRLYDENTAGCNHLIKISQAHLLESVADIAYILGWDKPREVGKVIQQELPLNLSSSEATIIEAMGHDCRSIDELVIESRMEISTLSTELLMMELKGLVKQLPGKKYKVV